MPSKKKKYNARFPAGRIKKIMQTDEEVGKVAQAVPVIISRTLELFVESLLTKTLKITNARNAKTLSPSHMKQCIISESRFDFLRDLVKNIPDIGINEDLSGSEAGYGAEGTSPASTSTSSSSASFSNGASAAAGVPVHHQHHHHPYEAPTQLQRSESYSPASVTVSLTGGGQNSQTQKRSASQAGSLNFYKEIPLEGTSSPPPPPKLTRLHSAPAGGVQTARLPFKIDILPNLPPASATASPAGKNTTIGAITPQISYKFERLSSSSSSPTAATTLEPVIKLDYSNLRLPASSSSSSSSSSLSAAASSTRGSAIQPTIKIDLSNIATSSSSSSSLSSGPTTGDGSSTPKQAAAATGTGRHHAASAPSTPATTPVIQSPLSSAPPIYSAMSSTIPGMDEDYDDI